MIPRDARLLSGLLSMLRCVSGVLIYRLAIIHGRTNSDQSSVFDQTFLVGILDEDALRLYLFVNEIQA